MKDGIAMRPRSCCTPYPAANHHRLGWVQGQCAHCGRAACISNCDKITPDMLMAGFPLSATEWAAPDSRVGDSVTTPPRALAATISRLAGSVMTIVERVFRSWV